jgi:hypothetical protein
MRVGGVDKAKNVRCASFEFARATMERHCERRGRRESQQPNVEEDRWPPRLFVEGIEFLVGSHASEERHSLPPLRGKERSMRNKHQRVNLLENGFAVSRRAKEACLRPHSGLVNASPFAVASKRKLPFAFVAGGGNSAHATVHRRDPRWPLYVDASRPVSAK